MFTYCLNNPVNMVDSCGNWPQWIEDAAGWVTGNVINPIISFINDIAEANALGQSTLSDTSKPPLPAGAYSSYWDLIKLFL